MSEEELKEDFKGIPECGNINCEHAKIVWKDGRRYVSTGTPGESYVAFDSFVQTALQQLVEDLGDIIKRLDLIERYGLPLPASVKARKPPVEETWEDVSGLVP